MKQTKPRNPQPTPVAWGRAEDEPCQAGTIGCSVDHSAPGGDVPCETW